MTVLMIFLLVHCFSWCRNQSEDLITQHNELSATGRKVAFPVVTSMQDFCRIHVFQLSYSNPPTILEQTHHVALYISCYNRTYHVYIHTFPTPGVILVRPCNPPCHMILTISCTTGYTIMWMLYDPYHFLYNGTSCGHAPFL